MLAIDGLTIAARGADAVLDGVSCRLHAGDRLGVVGESGAGKTTLGLAALGIVRPGLDRVAGGVRLAGQDIFALGERARRRLRRQGVAWLGQDPATALTPTMPVRAQIAELLDAPTPAGIADRLRAVSLPDDQEFLRRLPGQLSGGQQRRVALARALAVRPRLVVLDEPTAGLDPVTAREVMAELDRLQGELGFALLLISHDLDLVADCCPELLVLYRGMIVERGDVLERLDRPHHEYTRALVAAHAHEWLRRSPAPAPAAPALPAPPAPPAGDGHADKPMLEVIGLSAGFGRGADHGSTGRASASVSVSAMASEVLSGVSFEVGPGECVALIGASGSGKTTLVRSLAGLHPPRSGRVLLDGEPLPEVARLRRRSERAAVQLVPQDPSGSLHPRRGVLDSVARPLRLLHGASRRSARDAAGELLDRVGVGATTGNRRPHELSGGQRQRVALARALAAEPRVLLCDEITSALDATTAHAVLRLLAELIDTQRLAVLFVTHDSGAVRRIADRTLVLDAGRIRASDPTRLQLGAS